MALVPNTKTGKIEFFQSKIAPWTTNAVAIGTTVAEVTALEAKVTEATDALAAQVAAKAAAETATQTPDRAVEAMAQAGAQIISEIRTKAGLAGDSVYDLAQIPVPATPAPKPAPAKCTDFAVEIDEDGSIKLTWKCANPPGTSGTLYQVWRKSPDTEFVYLGGCGSKEFTDATIPPGTSSVTYQIQAVRSTAVGPWAQYNVNFSVGAAAVVTETRPAKMAA